MKRTTRSTAVNDLWKELQEEHQMNLKTGKKVKLNS